MLTIIDKNHCTILSTCVYICLCGGWTHVCEGQVSLKFRSSGAVYLGLFGFVCFKMGSLTNLELTEKARLVDWQALGFIHLCLQYWGYEHASPRQAF